MGECYNEKNLRKGLEKAREVYGGAGYWEFTGFPDFKFRDDPTPGRLEAPESIAAPLPAIVDVTMRLQEGTQYFVNRITFVGNTTTHDTVIRREMRLVEDSVFNTEALKYSVKRINQLGYFKPLEEGKGVDVNKMPSETDKVDVKLKLEEQNRNQISFGAGVSQFEGFFGQLSFQTSNFLGRGESLTLSMQAGSLAQNYTLGVHRAVPVRPQHDGRRVKIFKQEIHYLNQFTQTTTGGTLTFGVPVGRGFTRFFTNYSYQRVRVSDINAVYTDPTVLRRNPFLQDSLLIGQGGERDHQHDHAEPRAQHGGQPDLPDVGQAFHAVARRSRALAANVSFYKPTRRRRVLLEAEQPDEPRSARATCSTSTSSKARSRCRFSRSCSSAASTPCAGSTSGSIGPSDPVTGLVLGGDKSLLFNIEQSFVIAGPVRAILFYDAGQVREAGQSFGLREDILELVAAARPLLVDPRAPLQLVDPNLKPAVHTRRPAERVQDVDGRRGPVLHAGAERAVPPDLLYESPARRRPRQLAAAAAGVRIPLRRRLDLLRNADHVSIARSPIVSLNGRGGRARSTTSACSDNTLSQLAAASATPSNPSTETFTGTLSQNGAFTHIFTIQTLGAVTVSIVNLRRTRRRWSV